MDTLTPTFTIRIRDLGSHGPYSPEEIEERVRQLRDDLTEDKTVAVAFASVPAPDDDTRSGVWVEIPATMVVTLMTGRMVLGSVAATARKVRKVAAKIRESTEDLRAASDDFKAASENVAVTRANLAAAAENVAPGLAGKFHDWADRNPGLMPVLVGPDGTETAVGGGTVTDTAAVLGGELQRQLAVADEVTPPAPA
jgi:hypothetical protein